MQKIVIVGTTKSGKTCYFYGMMRKMLRGENGFAISVSDSAAYQKLRTGMRRLGDTALPMEERWPAPSFAVEEYDLKLLHNLKEIAEIHWTDYPGENAELVKPEFIELLKGADCFLVCVDGSRIQGSPSEIENIADDFFYNYGGMDLCNAINQANKQIDEEAAKGDSTVNSNTFPPVCVIITKYDQVSPELRTEECIEKFVRLSFPALFDSGSGKNRFVTICPVTLGKDIENGGKLAPVNVEKPILLAPYLMMAAEMQQKVNVTNEYIKGKEAEIAKYNERGPIGKIISRKPQPLTEEEKAAIRGVLANSRNDVDEVRAIVETLPLYINGERTGWD